MLVFLLTIIIIKLGIVQICAKSASIVLKICSFHRSKDMIVITFCDGKVINFETFKAN